MSNFKKKSILIIIGSLNMGGTEKQLLMQLKYLRKFYNFTIIILEEKGDLFEEFKNIKIKIIDISNTSKLKSVNFFILIIRLFKTFKKTNPDMVHYYLPRTYLLGGFLPYFFSSKIYIMSRRSMNFYQKKYFLISFIEKILHQKMDLIIANSMAVKKQLIEEEGVRQNSCQLIYNGVEIKKARKKNKNKKIKILCLANILEYKNHELIIKACTQIPKNLNYIIYFVGNDLSNLSEMLKEKISQFCLNEKIVFCGRLMDPQSYLKNSDIGILVSNEEGFSNTILEYMSYGLPVIATDVGGNSESVRNNYNGFLIKNNNVQELTSKLVTLIKNEKKRILMGKNGFELVKKQFKIALSVKKYKKTFDKLLMKNERTSFKI